MNALPSLKAVWSRSPVRLNLLRDRSQFSPTVSVQVQKLEEVELKCWIYLRQHSSYRHALEL